MADKSSRTTRLNSKSACEDDQQTKVTLDDTTMIRLTKMISETIENKLEEKLSKINTSLSSLIQFKDNCETRFSRIDSNYDRLEQYSRRNNIIIYGIKESTNENVDDLVLSFLREKMKINCKIEDFERAHRIGQPKTRKTRAIIVKFTSYRTKAEIYKNKSSLKGTTYLVKEDLTKYRVDLLKMAIEKFGFKKVWTSDGNIIAMDSSGQRRKITEISDL